LKYLADTNLLSELLKTRPNPGVMRWLLSVDENDIAISVITLGELQRGASRLRPGDQQTRLQTWIDSYIIPRFSGRFIGLGIDEMLEWGNRYGLFERQGRPRSVLDSLLAVTALTNNLAVVSRNVRDVDDWGVEVINPWDDEDGA
jgi:predicted nucleic acid-binding protein